MVSQTQPASALPTLYIPHGGGPCFFMEDPPGMAGIWNPLGAWLRSLLAQLDTAPRAILVVSAHWEERQPTVTSAAQPPLLFDYYGFPPHTYALRYAAPGSPELAARVQALLGGAGLAAGSDAQRGFDHGVFVPFLLIAPEATIPIVQLSLVSGLDPDVHLAMGSALAPLRSEGVLIVGSGMSYHNMRAMMSGKAALGAAEFDRWLVDAVSAEPASRNARLGDWVSAPAARLAHPREEHLVPLFVAAGAAGTDRGARVFADRILGFEISGFRFG